MKSPTITSISTLMSLLAVLLAYTHAFSVTPSVVHARSLQSTSSTELFHRSSILERPLKAPKKKMQGKKTKARKCSSATVKASSVGSLILLLNDPQVRHKVRRRPLLIPNGDGEKRQCKATRAFQEGQELARIAVMEVLKEYNIDDVSV